jgi:hypothetical protein
MRKFLKLANKRKNVKVVPAKYNYNDEVKEDEMARARSTHRRNRAAFRILVGKPEGKRPLGRPSVGGRIRLKLILER